MTIQKNTFHPATNYSHTAIALVQAVWNIRIHCDLKAPNKSTGPENKHQAKLLVKLQRLILLLLGRFYHQFAITAPIDLDCAPLAERETLILNEVSQNESQKGNMRLIEVKILEDQTDISIYKLCLANFFTGLKCRTLGSGKGEWSLLGYPDDEGPDPVNPTVFNKDIYITYDFNYITPRHTEILLQNEITGEVIDYFCISNLNECGTDVNRWRPPAACGSLIDITEFNLINFSRHLDGEGSWVISNDAATIRSNNDTGASSASVCNELIRNDFGPIYSKTQIDFIGNNRIDIIGQTKTKHFQSSRTLNGTYLINGDGRLLGGDFAPPTVNPGSFPNWSSTADDEVGFLYGTLAAGNWNNVIAYAGSTTASSGTYNIKHLSLETLLFADPTFSMNSGDYFIDQLDIEVDGRLESLESTVAVYIGSDANIGDNVNITTSSGDPADLTFYVYPGASLVFGDNVSFTGNIVALGSNSSIIMGSNYSQTGSIFSEGFIAFNGDATFTYNDAVVLSQQLLFDCTIPVPTTPSYFRITSSSSALTCSPQPVNISAYYADDTLAINYAGSVSLRSRSLTASDTGDWLDSTQSVLTGNATIDDGWTSLDFTLADAGSIDLFLADTHAGTVNIDVFDAALSIAESASFDPDITFDTAGFQWLDDTNNVLPSATVPHLVAGTGADVIVRAVTTDPLTGQCSNLFADTTDVSISFGSQCTDPGSCYAGQRISAINNGNAFDFANTENPIAGQPTTTQLVRFGANSTTSLSLTSPDVGKMQLDAHYDLLDAAGNPTGDTISGSRVLVSRPHHLAITGVVDTSSNVNPGTQSAAGGAAAFIAAGDLLHIQVEGRSSDNTITPSFGSETTIPQPGLTSSLVAPATGTLGTLVQTGNWVKAAPDGVVTFITASTGLSYSEVGAIQLTPTLDDYQGTGTVTGTVSEVIGRFTPAEFDVSTNSPVISAAQAACGFIYRDQDLLFNTPPGFSITALNALGAVTTNYDQEFFTLPASLNMGGVVLSDSGSAWVPSMNWVGQWIQQPGYDGVVKYQIDNLNLARNTTPTLAEAPIINPVVRVTLFDTPISGSSLIHDSGNVCYSPGVGCSDYAMDLTLGGMQWLYGRASLTNNYGPETRDLTIPVYFEYWDGAYWKPQILENGCTSLLTSDFSLGSWTIETGIPVTSINSWSGINIGEGQLLMAAPGVGNTGSVPLALDVPDYLKYHWDEIDASCAADSDLCLDNLVATVRFGIYEGRKPILYRFQVFR